MNLLSATDEKFHTRIIGDLGDILVHGGASRPDGYTIRKYKNPKSAGVHDVSGIYEDKQEKVNFEFKGVGWNWEADAVARCLRGE